MIKKEPIGSHNVFSFLIKDKYIKILKPFYENKDKAFYVNQLKEITGISPRILIAELKNLEKEGILTSEHVANALFYRLNKDSLKAKQIEVVFL